MDKELVIDILKQSGVYLVSTEVVSSQPIEEHEWKGIFSGEPARIIEVMGRKHFRLHINAVISPEVADRLGKAMKDAADGEEEE